MSQWQASLNLERYDEAVQFASQVLEKDAKNVKALYRLGLAYAGQGKYQEAQAKMQEVAQLDPRNKAAKTKAAEFAERAQ